jgi:hypothetical protein
VVRPSFIVIAVVEVGLFGAASSGIMMVARLAISVDDDASKKLSSASPMIMAGCRPGRSAGGDERNNDGADNRLVGVLGGECCCIEE